MRQRARFLPGEESGQAYSRFSFTVLFPPRPSKQNTHAPFCFCPWSPTPCEQKRSLQVKHLWPPSRVLILPGVVGASEKKVRESLLGQVDLPRPGEAVRVCSGPKASGLIQLHLIYSERSDWISWADSPSVREYHRVKEGGPSPRRRATSEAMSGFLAGSEDQTPRKT